MSTFGKDESSSSAQPGTQPWNDDPAYQDPAESIEMKTATPSKNPATLNNGQHKTSPAGEKSRSEPDGLAQGGYNNLAYASLGDVRLGVANDPHIYTVPLEGGHAPGSPRPPHGYLKRYQSETENRSRGDSAKKGCCASNAKKICLTVILLVLVIGGAAGTLYYFLGWRNSGNEIPILARARRAAVNMQKEFSDFLGTVKVDYNYTNAYEDPSTAEYQNLSNTFTQTLGAALEESTLYNFTEVLNFRPGSIEIQFRSSFNQKVPRQLAEALVTVGLRNVSQHLPLLGLTIGFAGLQGPADSGVCDTNLTYCEPTKACLHPSRTCNGRVDCPNLVDEPLECSDGATHVHFRLRLQLFPGFLKTHPSVHDAASFLGYTLVRTFHENAAYSNSFSTANAVMGLEGDTGFVHLILSEPLHRTQVEGIVSPLEQSPGAGPGSITLTEFNPATQSLCGDPAQDFFVCDYQCHLAASVRCNHAFDCSSWADEYRCGEENPTCDFESGACGYLLEKSTAAETQFGWKVGAGLRANSSLLSPVRYLYTGGDCMDCKKGTTTTATSPIYLSEPHELAPEGSRRGQLWSCLTFWYRMSGPASQDYGALYVLLHDQVGREELLWSREGSQGPGWHLGRASIPPGAYTFSFVATWGGANEVEKAVDDIVVVEGDACQPNGCSLKEYCAVRDECIPMEKECDGKADCPDESDEYCDGNSCSFPPDRFSECNFNFPTSSCEFCWQLLRGGNPGFLVWHDNTYRDGYGFYAGIDFTAGKQGDKAVLKMGIPVTNNSLCFSFHHNFITSGDVPTKVRVVQYFLNPLRGNVTLWEGEPTQGSVWEQAQASVGYTPDPFELGFEVIKGSTNGTGSWAVDDVAVLPGLCQCTLDRFVCPKSTRCIPNGWMCDGEKDCDSFADEHMCNLCAMGEFECHDHSCVPGGSSVVCDGHYDCEDGSDENECADTNTFDGEVSLRFRKDAMYYLEVCYADWPESLNGRMCEYLSEGFIGTHTAINASANSTRFLRYSQDPNSSLVGSNLQRDLGEVSSCPNNAVVRLACSRDVCGQPVVGGAEFIIGGEEVGAGRWPWVASIQQVGFGHQCGGALINENWVLSAAHCFANPSDNYQVLLGAGHIEGAEDHVQRIHVEKITIFPGFQFLQDQSGLKGGDAALLLLSQPAVYNNYVRPLCIPSADRDFSQRASCFIAGWGLVQYPSVEPTLLMEAKMKVFPMDTCNRSWSGVLTDSMVCAGYTSNTVRTCAGDSGGLLFCRGATKRYEAHGVLSFGPENCEAIESKTDVYTRVAPILPWLRGVSEFKFECANGEIILDDRRLCDGANDCGDESDERLPCEVTVACEFESAHVCGWNRERTSWRRASGGVVPRMNGVEPPHRPLYDHTTGRPPTGPDASPGQFMWAVKPGRLVTPLMNTDDFSSGGVCVEFYYYAFGHPEEVGLLSLERSCLSAVDGESCTGSVRMWNHSTFASEHNFWIRALVDAPRGNYSLSFVSRGVNAVSDPVNLSIDDMTINPGPCSSVTCPQFTFACADGLNCIDSRTRCDGIRHCSDGSDELLCPGGVPARGAIIASCTFEEQYACGVRQPAAGQDDFDWVLFKNDTFGTFDPVEGTAVGPPAGQGHYLLSVTSSTDVSEPMATFEWPLRRLSTSACLSFRYHMFGQEIGSFELYPGSSRETRDVLWEAYGTQANGWRRGLANVSAGVEGITFITTARGPTANHIAVDDLTLTAGPCAEFRCEASEFLCSDVCVLQTYVCDEVLDCPNYEDEACHNWTVSCTFESGSCGYYQPTIPRPMSAFFWRIIQAADDITGPPGQGSGSYYAIRGWVQGDDRSVDLSSPAISSPLSPTCLRFVYYIADDDAANPSELDLFSEEVFFRRKQTLWKGRRPRMQSTPAAGTPMALTGWRSARVTLPAGRTVVGFEGLYGGSPGGVGLSLDNVTLDSGQCPPFECPAGKFVCAWEEVCLDSNKVCDGNFDCIDQSDERGCSESLANCDFDEGLCGWEQSLRDQMDWRLQSGVSHRERLTGPSSDHTRDNHLGQYLHLPSGQLGDVAVLLTRKESAGVACMTFYYHMVGRDIGSLRVIANETTVVRITGTQANEWKPVKVSLLSGAPYDVIIIGESGGVQGHIGLDDITFVDGRCECSGLFQCNSGECFEANTECDFQEHCMSVDDEHNECPCPAGGIRCPGLNNTCQDKAEMCRIGDSACHVPGNDFSLNCECQPGEIQCKFGLCYEEAFEYCNGFPYCPDGEDEPANCSCLSNQAQCNTGECYPRRYFCDEFQDCPDFSDEPLGCVPLGVPMHTCANGQTVEGTADELLCDGAAQCTDRSDEARPVLFECVDKSRNISRNQYCDGEAQCLDNSDEPRVCKCCIGEFQCHLSGLCIRDTKQCDGAYDCSDGSDEQNCTCTAGQFQCGGGLCLDNTRVCDRRLDCNDGSDEANCDCRVSEFTCTNSRCIANSLRCDGFDDCRDGSDESFCDCLPGEVMCANDTFHCIPPEWKCDRYADCPAGGDEEGCSTCTPDEFTCLDYSCTNVSGRCDGNPDCADASDEVNCVTSEPVEGSVRLAKIDRGGLSHLFCLNASSSQDRQAWADWLCEEMGGQGGRFTGDIVSKPSTVATANNLMNSALGPGDSPSLSHLQLTDQCTTATGAAALECTPRACGTSTKSTSSVGFFIIGGEKVSKATDWPWAAALYYNGAVSGGGSLINDQWVLTAAHAFVLEDGTRRDRVPHHFSVALGSLNRSTQSSESSYFVRARRIIIHEGFSRRTGVPFNDLALVQLETPVKLSPTVAPVCLPDEGASTTATPRLCYLSGWGYLNGDGRPADHLREIKMAVQDQRVCFDKWNKLEPGRVLYNTSAMICAGYDSITAGGCFGDSGGALSCVDSQGGWRAHGVLSFGELGDCRTGTLPNVFSSVASYIPWIRSHVDAEESRRR